MIVVTTVGHVTIYRHYELSPVYFFDEAAAHEAIGNERGAVVVHLFQQLLATVIDEANTCQINQKRRPLGWCLLPALVQFINARAG